MANLRKLQQVGHLRTKTRLENHHINLRRLAKCGLEQMEKHEYLQIANRYYRLAYLQNTEFLKSYEIRRSNVLFGLGRCFATFLQGTWFIQIAVILYNPFVSKLHSTIQL